MKHQRTKAQAFGLLARWNLTMVLVIAVCMMARILRDTCCVAQYTEVDPTPSTTQTVVLSEAEISILMREPLIRQKLPKIKPDVNQEMQDFFAFVQQREEEEKAKEKEAETFLFQIDNPDLNYHGSVVVLEAEDRDLCEHLVMGEAGNQGFEGAALVAQCIHDAIVHRGYLNVADVRERLQYSGSINTEPNQDVLDAVAYIFDEGKAAVQHEILFFYSGNNGKWHETQQFILEYKAHRFFCRWD